MENMKKSRCQNDTKSGGSTTTAAALIVSTACLCLLSFSDANNIRHGGSSSSSLSSSPSSPSSPLSSLFPVFVDSASTAAKTTTRKNTITNNNDRTASSKATLLRLNPEMPLHVRDILLHHHDDQHHYHHLATNSKNQRRSSLRTSHNSNHINQKYHQQQRLPAAERAAERAAAATITTATQTINHSFQPRQLANGDDDDCLTTYHMSITPSDPGYPHTCTNADHYPPDWDQPSIRKHLFYEEPGDCCAKYFGEGGECTVVDVCGEGSVFVIGGTGEESEGPTGVPTDGPTYGPTYGPTHAPTEAPTVTPTLESTSDDMECGAWHPDEKKMWTCTNDSNYTSTWTLFYPTGEACCQGFFNGPCTLIDACGGNHNDGDMNQQSDNALTPTFNPTNNPIATTSSPTRTPTNAPTNAPTNEPTNTPTTDPTGSPTIYTSICPTSTTTDGNNNKWHLSIDPNDIKTCTNDKNYPPSWDEASPQAQASVFFDSAVVCCVTMFGDVNGCNIVEVCHEVEEEQEQEQEQEEDPILPPCPGNKWHKSYQTGSPSSDTCTNDDQYPSSWNTYPASAQVNFFADSPEVCCEKFIRKSVESGGCIIVEVCDSSATTTTTTTTTTSTTTTTTTTTTTEDTTTTCSSPTYSTKWHVSTQPGVTRTCTNDNQYPPAWDAAPPQQQANLFFDSAKVCCTQLFGGMDGCNIVEICDDDDENNGDNDGESSCSTKWHVSTQPGASFTCTNDDVYPPSWDDATAEQQASMFFDSSTSCCTKLFGGMERCNVVSISCDDEDGNEGQVCSDWHPSTKEPVTCTNSGEYPAQFVDLGLLFATGDDCCSSYFPGAPCTKKEVCTPSPIVEQSEQVPVCGDWHPSIEEVKTCSNSLNYPPEWDNVPTIFFANYESCCEGYYKSPCKKHDACAPPTLPPTEAPTSTPTTKPTDSPTKKPTEAPTHAPTNELTTEPTGSPTNSSTIPLTNSSTIPPTTTQTSSTISPSSSPSATKTSSPSSFPTSPLTNSTQTQFTPITSAIDNFEGENPLPWILGNPPQWTIDSTVSLQGENSIRNLPPIGNGATSDLTLRIDLPTSALIRCEAKVDISMPFDLFEYLIDGEKRAVITSKKPGWTSVVTGVSPGEHTVVFRVKNADMVPPIPRVEDRFGTGFVWLDMCMISPVSTS